MKARITIIARDQVVVSEPGSALFHLETHARMLRRATAEPKHHAPKKSSPHPSHTVPRHISSVVYERAYTAAALLHYAGITHTLGQQCVNSIRCGPSPGLICALVHSAISYGEGVTTDVLLLAYQSRSRNVWQVQSVYRFFISMHPVHTHPKHQLSHRSPRRSAVISISHHHYSTRQHYRDTTHFAEFDLKFFVWLYS